MGEKIPYCINKTLSIYVKIKSGKFNKFNLMVEFTFNVLKMRYVKNNFNINISFYATLCIN